MSRAVPRLVTREELETLRGRLRFAKREGQTLRLDANLVRRLAEENRQLRKALAAAPVMLEQQPPPEPEEPDPTHALECDKGEDCNCAAGLEEEDHNRPW